LIDESVSSVDLFRVNSLVGFRITALNSQRKLATPIPERREKALKAADEELPGSKLEYDTTDSNPFDSDSICHGQF